MVGLTGFILSGPKNTNKRGTSLQIKTGVILTGLQLPMRRVMVEADKIWSDYGQELVITAGLDGEHMAGSFHYFGLALDLRTRYFDDADKPQIADRLRHALGPEYQVLNHSTHIHVEYQARP